VIAFVGISLAIVLPADGANRTDREHQGLKGPVGSIRIEVAKLSVSAGKVVEGPRVRSQKTIYDDKGNLVWETFYDADSIVGSHYYSYLSSDTQLEVAHIRRTNFPNSAVPRRRSTIRFKWTHMTDSAGNRTESIVRADDDALIRKFTYFYDRAGKLTSANQYGSTGTAARTWVYDSAGNVTEGKQFDESGLLTEQVSYAYEYDSQKNWVKRVTSRQTGSGKGAAVPIEVTYRTINYYNPAGDFQMNGGVIPGVLVKNQAAAVPGEGVLAGQALKRVAPEYPSAARLARISGSVVVELTVDEEGDVLSARATSGHPLLREAALDAAWDWKFSPTVNAGRAMKVIGTIEFNFHP
jgi:TonB family protein